MFFYFVWGKQNCKSEQIYLSWQALMFKMNVPVFSKNVNKTHASGDNIYMPQWYDADNGLKHTQGITKK